MATNLIDNILTAPYSGNPVVYTIPTSVTATESFGLKLNNSNDNIFIVADASHSSPGSYTLTFNKGDFISAKAPAPINFADGSIVFIPIESGMIEKKNATATFTVTTTISGGLVNTGFRLGVIKKRFVTAY
ncbi:MAG: hypothetical protein CVU97_05630 [Firmicutes bacterium HGW-Firmicutes-21]|nr:MAG: hypothetical protein CVU97_05630 [Firmicutes bacterium HGW-Firmicutes-21]